MKTKHFYSFLFALIFLSFASQAQNYYLYYPGITVGKGVKGHQDEVYLYALSNGFTKPNPTSAPSFADYSVIKNNDVTSIDMQKLAVLGTSTDGVEIRVYATASPSAVLTIQLKGVTISSYSISGSSQDGGCATCSGFTESISLNYTAVKIGTFMWNLTTNTPTY
ncbi:type VI secretion system tube protein Hcp [Dyadobacter sp. 3J3]|uniref:type VI secretion system tube protein Hcp n=1 Tax=Dyadobacter sp. 3J3 TaxID=2606600 RepID=UPI00135A6E37|nr:type VI secretion system tube protein Hcp [Dyadobacter sp. 3J3]